MTGTQTFFICMFLGFIASSVSTAGSRLRTIHNDLVRIEKALNDEIKQPLTKGTE